MSLNNIGLFHLDNNRITILGTDEEPWFVANEIGEVFGISNIRQNISTFPESWKSHVCFSYGRQGTQKTTIINELAVYRIAMRSNKPNAIDFQNRVAEILKELRIKGKYELERRNQILNERLIESEIAIQDRENTIHELEEKINNLQYITDDNNERITIIKRIIDMGYINQRVVDLILRDRIEMIDERICKVPHPDKKKFIGNLSFISSRLSKAKKRQYGEYPPISRDTRTNVYYERDFILYGDDIIHDYFLNKPFIQWGIDTTWMIEVPLGNYN